MATPANDLTPTPSTAPGSDPAATLASTPAVPTETPGVAPVATDTPPVPTATETATVAPTPTPTPTPTTTVFIEPSEAVLPGHRVIAYYGHPNSSAMGILGEFDKDEVLGLLREQAAEFHAADPDTPIVLAFELIATVAQPWPMDDGTYVAYTGDEIIGEFVEFVTANDMILILDLQIGHDTIPNQINLIRHWLEHPRVHVALDPEFSTGANETVPVDRIPGEFIGEADGRDIQIAMEMLAAIVAEHNLPGKILMVHQFEREMIYNKEAITPVPGVSFVLDMDGFGSPEAKLANYDIFVRDELIQYGGIKMFYRQDDPVLTPDIIVNLDPPPLVVIYQ
ncbi:MAG TPA: hypothetical protein VMM78_06880 [Thermomicrobiales bacterium]|nr:hypothetical protein [Thermomicrobiales bacterium]